MSTTHISAVINSTPKRSATPVNESSPLNAAQRVMTYQSTPARSARSVGLRPGNDTPMSRRSVRSSRTLQDIEDAKTGTVVSSTSNLANTVLGTGALAFPSAFSAMGLIPGALSCGLSAVTAAFGLYLLSRCATQTGVRPGEEGRKASFNEVARLAFNKSWVTRIFDVSTGGAFVSSYALMVPACDRYQVLWCLGILCDHLQGKCICSNHRLLSLHSDPSTKSIRDPGGRSRQSSFTPLNLSVSRLLAPHYHAGHRPAELYAHSGQPKIHEPDRSGIRCLVSHSSVMLSLGLTKQLGMRGRRLVRYQRSERGPRGSTSLAIWQKDVVQLSHSSLCLHVRLLTFSLLLIGHVLMYRCAQNVSCVAFGRGPKAADVQIFPIYNELKERSQAKMTGIIVGSIGTAAVVYEIVSQPASLR